MGFLFPLFWRIDFWQVSSLYVNAKTRGPEVLIINDLASYEGPAIPMETHVIDYPHDVRLFFQQPYDSSGEWVGSRSSFGALTATVYPSPQIALLEVLGVGLQRMSGALAVDKGQAEPVSGMLIRPNSLERRDSTPKSNGSSSKETRRNTSALSELYHMMKAKENMWRLLTFARC